MPSMTAYVALAVLGLGLTVGCGDDAGVGSADAAPPDAEFPWSDFEVTSGDVTLHVWTYGGHDGAPVMLLLNGGPGFSHDYMLGFSNYASPELRLVWFDQRGTGRSTQPMTSSYAFADYVADLEAVRSAIGAEELHIVGHSWGGGYALAYLAAQPQHVASMVLIDGLPPTWTATQAGLGRFSTHVQELQEAGIVPYPLPAVMNDDCIPLTMALYPAYVADPATVPPAEFGNATCRQSPLEVTFNAISGFDLEPQLTAA